MKLFHRAGGLRASQSVSLGRLIGFGYGRNWLAPLVALASIGGLGSASAQAPYNLISSGVQPQFATTYAPSTTINVGTISVSPMTSSSPNGLQTAQALLLVNTNNNYGSSLVVPSIVGTNISGTSTGQLSTSQLNTFTSGLTVQTYPYQSTSSMNAPEVTVTSSASLLATAPYATAPNTSPGMSSLYGGGTAFLQSPGNLNAPAALSVLGLSSAGWGVYDQYGMLGGGNGTTVTVTQAGGTLSAATSFPMVSTSPWSPSISGLYAGSFGGNGLAPTNTTAGTGEGGDGGTVTVTTNAGASIVLYSNTGSNSMVQTSNGITALSQGATGSYSCSVSNSSCVPSYTAPGVGGTVNVTHNGSITGIYNQYVALSGSIGISAASVGGPSACYVYNCPNGSGYVGTAPPVPGAGGNVTVNVGSTGSINLTGGWSAIGIMAISATGNVYEPNQLPTSGNVSVGVAAGAQITVGAPGAVFAVGVLGISTGSSSLLSPFTQQAFTNTYLAPSGNVTINNSGTVTTAGEFAIGLAALSVGGSGVATQTQTGSLSNLGSVAVAGNATSGTISVNNAGSIVTSGISAFGILATSAGAGGIATVDFNATFNSDKTAASGLILGSTATSTGAASGGSVTVQNSGSIQTGDFVGQGNMAIGIVAQSIGGGGGSGGGSGAAAFVGDGAGGGGNGGQVQVSNNGNITTSNDGAIAVLAQSIGGGGGNGGNGAGIFVAVGGQGGAGGTGGTVTFTNGGVGTVPNTVTTSGDFAAGVVAQSIGGGGGNGGYAKSVGAFASNSIGGTGGGGGAGGQVSFSTGLGTITTSGNGSHGALMQSIGGGGGNGGGGISHTVGVVFAESLAIGGTGGGGGAGGIVTATAGGNIVTSGPDAMGFVAQSIGGGGGNGGGALAKSFAAAADPDLPTLQFTTSVGGSGATGGAGGQVTLNVSSGSSILTSGTSATGLVAQSIGGGGGNGGDSTAGATIVGGKAGGLQITTAIGGGGAAASNGGEAQVFTSGLIKTTGNNGTGILAQSIGGGGGNGGGGNASGTAANAGAAGVSSGFVLGISTGVGGTGGGGGSGGTVTVTNYAGGSVITAGTGGQGILAQSIGGGGGNAAGGSAAGGGGTLNVNLSIGGTGGSGGVGNDVYITNNGTIYTGQTLATAATGYAYPLTTGGDAVGIFAQSIGGGGGAGGSSDPLGGVTTIAMLENVLAGPGALAYAANVNIGGKGGSGGSAGTVSVANTGSIQTLGIRAHGIIAHAIGGGGGSGGSVVTQPGTLINTIDGAISQWVAPVISATVALGGSGGTGGSGGAVTLSNSGTVITAGYGAVGILAQSIGGGGGIGADGSTGMGISLLLGGNGGSGNNGGTVQLGTSTTPLTGTIATIGDDAHAILAQSIGGGGGVASGICTNSASASFQSLTATRCLGNNTSISGTLVPWAATGALALNIPGSSGSTGNGDAVNIYVNGAIVTVGARAMGIVAQSIGGGGGFVTAAAGNIASVNLLSNYSQNASQGGAVTVSLGSSGSITTSGAGSWGIFAQSIGGGGGFLGDPSLAISTAVAQQAQSLPYGGTPAAMAGDINISLAGNITTTGTNAHGVVAQSIGGSGGVASGGKYQTGAALLMGNSKEINGVIASLTYAGANGAININQTGGVINASGPGSYGIVAQASSIQYDSGAAYPITVNISGGVSGGSGTGAGIFLSGGSNYATSRSVLNKGDSIGNPPNTITVNSGGVVTSAGGASGNAIIVASGPTFIGYNSAGIGVNVFPGYTNVINNAGGTITGTINLGASPGDFTNNGTWNVGSGTTNVFATNTITNNGVIHVVNTGGGTTVISGGYKQTATGMLVVDVDNTTASGAAPLLVKGNAQIAGAIVPNTRKLLPGTVPVIAATGTFSNSATTASTLLFNWQTVVSGNQVSLTPKANFNPSNVPLNQNQASAANYFQRAWANADPALAARFGYLAQLNDGASYQQALNSYAGRGLGMGPVLASLYSADLLSAPLSCQVFAGGSTKVIQDDCVWGKVVGGVARSTATDGFNGSNMMWRMGGQLSIAPDVYVGAAFGIGGNRVSTDGFSGSGGAYDISAAIKYLPGNWEFSGSLGLGLAQYQNNRYTLFPAAGSFASETSVQQSNVNSYSGGIRLRAAYSFAFDSWYIRPYADLDFITMHMPGFSEYSSGGANGVTLYRQASTDTQVRITPMLEFGLRRDLSDGWIFRPTLGIGMSAQSNRTLSSQLDVIGASPLNGSITSTTTLPQAMGRVSAAVQFYRVGVFDLRFEYDVMAAPSFIGQSGFFKAAYHF